MNNSFRFDSDLQVMSNSAKVLSHPARLMILKFLSQQDRCVFGEIFKHVPLAPSTISQHLKELKAAGLISSKEEGTSVWYCCNYKALEQFRQEWQDWWEQIKPCDSSDNCLECD